MTLNPSKGIISVMYDHTHFFACKSEDIMPQVKWAVNLVIANDYFSLPHGDCVGMYMQTHSFYKPGGKKLHFSEHHFQSCGWSLSGSDTMKSQYCSNRDTVGTLYIF